MLTWIITGAAGHLGGTLVRLLEEADGEVRGLVLPGEARRVISAYSFSEGVLCIRNSSQSFFTVSVPPKNRFMHQRAEKLAPKGVF